MTEEIKEEIIENEKVEYEKEEKSYEEFDLEKYGDLKAESNSKPIFEEVTSLKIKKAELRMDKTEIEDESGSYKKVYLNTTFDYEDKETWESYGGGRLYLSEKGAKFWLSDKSALGKLKILLETTFDFNGTIKEIPELIEGKTAGIKTENTSFGGKEYSKNTIVQFN